MAMSSCRESSISDLPDEILGKILSFLPTKVAASTTVLSKRWRNLLGLVDSLCFDESAVVYPNEEEETSGLLRFCDFVDKTFALLSNSHIKKFSLSRVHEYNDHVNQCIKRWICTALERDLLEIYLHAPPWSAIPIEMKLLTSNTLVKLTLSARCFVEVEHVFLPALKSLSLFSIRCDHPTYVRLIDGCPVLEELYLRDGEYPMLHPSCGTHLESASVKRLVVFTSYPDTVGIPIYFEAPSLVYLEYSCYVCDSYQLVDLDLLVEARLGLKLYVSTNDYDYVDDHDNYDYYSDDEPKTPIFGDVTNLVAGITNITTLHLSPDSLEVLHFCCESMPVFKNLLNLSIESNKDKGWHAMPLLLKSCPNLHTLLIKGLVHRVTNRCGDACPCIPKMHKRRKNKKRTIVKKEHVVSCLWTCQVKLLEISEYGGSFQELKQMKHFLGKLECLETLKVGVDADTNNSEFLRANLLTLPRLSSNCSIQFT